MFASSDDPRDFWIRDFERNDRTTRSVITGGMSVGLFAGLASAAFAVAGLAGHEPFEMGALAMIAIAVALVVEGWALAARWHDGTHVVGRESIDVLGIVAQMLGGFACLVLGLVAAAGVAPETALASASLVLGVSLAIGGPSQQDLPVLAPTASPCWRMTRNLEKASTRIMVAGGVVAFVLGAVAFAVPELSLVASLVGAVAVILAGSPVFARFTRRLVCDASRAA
jgi:hypothetical protein